MLAFKAKLKFTATSRDIFGGISLHKDMTFLFFWY